MFTDIVGYTALMGSDEDRAFKVLRKNRNIQKPLIKKYHGKWLKEMGDGILASFNNSSDAVRCAGEIQHIAKNEGISLRIGIHEGEVVFEEGDVLGDGVNVASRLEELAEAGCINVSGSVYKDIKNKAGIVAEFIGEKVLKNVDDPVKIYKVECEEPEEELLKKDILSSNTSRFSIFVFVGVASVIIVLLIWQFLPEKESISSSVLTDKSIAVLPFTDISPEKDQEYFSDGIMDAILMHLCKIGDLEVTSRTSVMQYKGTTKTITQIADELGVAHVLEGSVSKSGDRIRIIAQLIDAKNDRHLWAETYEKDLLDVFAVQSEVAQKITSSLKAKLSSEVKERIETEPTDNMTAYDYYLKGNEAYWRSWDGRVQSIMLESVNYYEKAIDLDPNFSLAYTGLGRSYWWLGMEAKNADRPEFYQKSKIYLKKAIDLDPYNGWAYAELGVVTMDWDWDSTATRKNLDMAVKLMPNDPNAYIHYFFFEERLGNCDQMIIMQKNLKRFLDNIDDPLNPYSLMILRCQKKYSEIDRITSDRYSEINPFGRSVVFWSLICLNEYEKAETLASLINTKNNAYYITKGTLKAKRGDRETALAMCDSLELMNSRNGFIAEIHAALGDKEKMYEYLNKAISEREALHQFIGTFPELIDCEDDPEFQKIKREIWIPRKD
jgi:TolB-like protein